MKHRDISPIMQAFRNFLAGRKVVIRLRFPDELSARTQPLPILPEGPSDKLFANHYYQRCPWQNIKPSQEIYMGQPQKQMEGEQEHVEDDQKQLEEINVQKDVSPSSEHASPSNRKSSNSNTSRKGLPLPGKKYRWD